MAGEVKKLSFSEGVSVSNPTDLSFGSQTQFTIANNQASPTDITGLAFSSATVHAAQITFSLDRTTSSANLFEVGNLFVVYDSFATAWVIAGPASFNDDAGVTFSITAGGQVQYTSTNMSGTGYAGTFRSKTINLSL